MMLIGMNGYLATSTTANVLELIDRICSQALALLPVSAVTMATFLKSAHGMYARHTQVATRPGGGLREAKTSLCLVPVAESMTQAPGPTPRPPERVGLRSMGLPPELACV